MENGVKQEQEGKKKTLEGEVWGQEGNIGNYIIYKMLVGSYVLRYMGISVLGI